MGWKSSKNDKESGLGNRGESTMEKILYIHHGSAEGGAPRSLVFLIRQLDRTKYVPIVLCMKDRERNEKLFSDAGAEVIYDESVGPWHGSEVSGISLGTIKRNLKYCVSTYNSICRIVKQVKPSIVHLNSTCLFLAARAIKHIDRSIPVICHVREPILKGFWGDILRKGNSGCVDHFIAIEQYDAESLGAVKVPVSVIYNFVDFTIYNSKIKSNVLYQELGIPNEHTILLYLARVIEQNGALTLIEKLQDYLLKKNSVHLVIVGLNNNCLSPYEKKVINLAANNPFIHILPFRTDVPEVIASSDIMIVPFEKPHFARSVIEAAAVKVPSIVSNVGGLKELVIDGETGLMYNNKESLVQCCQRLIDNNYIREEMAANAEKYALDNFDSVKNAKRVFEIYEGFLEGN